MRQVIQYPHPILKSKAIEVDTVNDHIHALWENMTAVMEAMPGIGLAAPQIGVGLRLAVIDASSELGQVIRMANPEILHHSVKIEAGEEASPCLPGISAVIKRPRGVTVKYMDHTGTVVCKDLVGLWARSVQHQIDHLNGRMYFDNLSKLKRDMLLKKAAKR
ncbi:MAG: peptide deformylase [Pseudomonadota bacterium]